jgi:hypothetical protein
MQTHSIERNIESTFTGEKKKFKIEASAKAFQILSSNLYSDKPLAIIRELSCNAADAHRDAGQDKPFVITLPTALNPSLEIRDYGTGMSQEKVEHMYSTFFASDKNNTNIDIGGLGLGSKSPFSYTDTFTLIVYYEGLKYTYLCLIDRTGEPATQLAMEPETTDEHNGVHYIIPIKSENFGTFRTRAERVLSYFPEGSYEVNTEVSPVKYSVYTDMYAIREDASYGERYINIVMGPVPYKLDKSALPDELQREFRTLLNDKPFDLFCNIGDVEVQPSREALSYDEESTQRLKVILSNVRERVRKDIEAELTNCTTYIDACLKATELGKYFPSSNSGLTWRSKQTHSSFDASGTDLVDASDITEANALRLSYHSYFNMNIDVIARAKIVYYDSSIPLNNLRLKQHLKDNRDKSFHVFKSKERMLEWMWKLELFDYIDVEDLPVPERELVIRNGKKTRSAPVKLKIRTGADNWESIEKTVEQINEMDNICWAPLEGNGNEPWAKSKHSKLHQALNIMDDSFTMLGIPKSLMHKVKHLVIPDIEEYTRAKMINYIGTEEKYEAAFVARSEIEWLDELVSYAPTDWKHLDVFKYAEMHTTTARIMKLTEVADLFGWDTKKQFSYVIEAKYRKRYKVFDALEHIWSVHREFINDVFELTDSGEQHGVHNQQPVSNDNRE